MNEERLRAAVVSVLKEHRELLDGASIDYFRFRTDEQKKAVYYLCERFDIKAGELL